MLSYRSTSRCLINTLKVGQTSVITEKHQNKEPWQQTSKKETLGLHQNLNYTITMTSITGFTTVKQAHSYTFWNWYFRGICPERIGDFILWSRKYLLTDNIPASSQQDELYWVSKPTAPVHSQHEGTGRWLWQSQPETKSTQPMKCHTTAGSVRNRHSAFNFQEIFQIVRCAVSIAETSFSLLV